MKPKDSAEKPLVAELPESQVSAIKPTICCWHWHPVQHCMEEATNKTI